MQKLMFIFFLAIFIFSCTENDGGKCHYDKVNAYIVIDSILPEKNTIYFKLFDKSDNEEIIHQGHPIRSYDFDNLNTYCVSVGDTLSVIANLINRGTCGPYYIEFIDYPECFNSDWW